MSWTNKDKEAMQLFRTELETYGPEEAFRTIEKLHPHLFDKAISLAKLARSYKKSKVMWDKIIAARPDLFKKKHGK